MGKKFPIDGQKKARARRAKCLIYKVEARSGVEPD